LLVENGEYLTELCSNTAGSNIGSPKIIVKRGYTSPVKIHFCHVLRARWHKRGTWDWRRLLK